MQLWHNTSQFDVTMTLLSDDCISWRRCMVSRVDLPHLERRIPRGITRICREWTLLPKTKKTSTLCCRINFDCETTTMSESTNNSCCLVYTYNYDRN